MFRLLCNSCCHSGPEPPLYMLNCAHIFCGRCAREAQVKLDAAATDNGSESRVKCRICSKVSACTLINSDAPNHFLQWMKPPLKRLSKEMKKIASADAWEKSQVALNLATAEKQVKRSAERLQKYQTKMNEMKNEYTQLKTRKTQLLEERKSLNQQIVRVKEKRTDLKRSKDSLHARLDKHNVSLSSGGKSSNASPQIPIPDPWPFNREGVRGARTSKSPLARGAAARKPSPLMVLRGLRDQPPAQGSPDKMGVSFLGAVTSTPNPTSQHGGRMHKRDAHSSFLQGSFQSDRAEDSPMIAGNIPLSQRRQKQSEGSKRSKSPFFRV